LKNLSCNINKLVYVNINGKGSQPDPFLKDKDEKLKKPIVVEANISLSCLVNIIKSDRYFYFSIYPGTFNNKLLLIDLFLFLISFTVKIMIRFQFISIIRDFFG
jgi:hypothetical protein